MSAAWLHTATAPNYYDDKPGNDHYDAGNDDYDTGNDHHHKPGSHDDDDDDDNNVNDVSALAALVSFREGQGGKRTKGHPSG